MYVLDLNKLVMFSKIFSMLIERAINELYDNYIYIYIYASVFCEFKLTCTINLIFKV